MPRGYLSDRTSKDNYRRGMIAQGMTEREIAPGKVAKSIGMSETTMSRRKRDPETFTIREVIGIAKQFGWDDAKVTQFVLGRES